ncbi:MAG: hypothetical protein ACKVQT_23375 [Burkholderiales bacterium]
MATILFRDARLIDGTDAAPETRDVVVTCNRNAKIMGRPHELGQIRKGFLADLLLVHGDPLADIRTLQYQARLAAMP